MRSDTCRLVALGYTGEPIVTAGMQKSLVLRDSQGGQRDEMALPGSALALALAPLGDWAVARVTDTGAGVDSDARSGLFEPFATTKDGGTGLGLAASLEIARGHGGDLIALTSVSAGASFVLRLPIAGGAK